MRVFDQNRRKGEAGYSVIELGVVVMIGGIITATAITMFANGKQRYDLTRQAQKLTWEIERARSLAVKYNQTLTLGFSNNSLGLTCTGCDTAKTELGSITFPSNITFSSKPTLTINGNGTISGGSSITIGDSQSRQVTVSVANSGRVTVGSVSNTTTQGQ
jgi:type II secretory pathway pseudopilin PulG